MAAMTPWITFQCRFHYAGGFALEGEFAATGEVTALFGPSGSGKTTILSLIAGLLRPQQGRIELCGETVLDTSKRVAVLPEKRRVGLCFQDHCLFPHLRVAANIAYGARRRNVNEKLMRRAIEILELSDLLDRFPRQLSGGQQQRVALARALASGPRALLLDEPLTAVEAELRDRVVAFIQRIVCDMHLPVLLVSHNRELVDRLASQVVEVREGRVL
jgi:molybdate transport system ATP-binding protein